MKYALLRNTSLHTMTALMIGLVSQAYAAPEGGKVVGGNASIAIGAGKIDIFQHSDKAVIDWHSFNIDPGEITEFHQPSSSSSTLNRVMGGLGASRIDGALKANGNVVLVNPDGVMFSKGAKVDVGSLLATTADIDTKAFMKGSGQFDKAGNPDARIVNDGTITAKEAGLVGLVAPNVENNGIIRATLGKITLGAGETFAVDLYGDKLIRFGISPKAVKQLVRNTGRIDAAGGEVNITAAAGKQLVENLVQVKGEILAPTVSAGRARMFRCRMQKSMRPGKTRQAAFSSAAMYRGVAIRPAPGIPELITVRSLPPMRPRKGTAAK